MAVTSGFAVRVQHNRMAVVVPTVRLCQTLPVILALVSLLFGGGAVCWGEETPVAAAPPPPHNSAPPVWASSDPALIRTVLDYADVVDPKRQPSDARWGEVVLRRFTHTVAATCGIPGSTTTPRAVAPPGMLADAVHSAYLGRTRALKARLDPAGPQTITLREVDSIGAAWLHTLVHLVLQFTPQPDTDAIGGLGHTPVQLAAAYMDHIALAALLRRGVSCSAVGASGQLTAFDFAERNCDTKATQMLMDSCGEQAPTGGPSIKCAVPGSALPSARSVDPDVARAQQTAWAATQGSGWRRSMDEDPAWQPGDADPAGLPLCSRILPTVAMEDLTAKRWTAHLAAAATPLVVLNATTSWKLHHSFQGLALETPPVRDVDLMTSQIPYGEHYKFQSGLASFGEMMQYLDRRRVAGIASSTPPLYAFDAEMLRATFGGDYALPPEINASFRGWGLQTHQLALGPEGSGSPFHFHEDAINALIYGRKMWDLLPPSRAKFSVEAPWCRGVGGGVGQASCRAAPVGGLRCVQLPGDLIYVPRRWAHSTLNLAEGVAIAVESDGTTCFHHSLCDSTVV
eukprot:m.357053 g.357053  ORF g.357053 m.357053 type:complete len:571 (+) comp28021_c0_seq8:5354-7066(+)